MKATAFASFYALVSILLVIVLSVPSTKLCHHLESHVEAISHYFQDQASELRENGIFAPIYTSFDIRDAGFKATVVDTNAFPSGFNILDNQARKQASEELHGYILARDNRVRDVLIIGEDHTRNMEYVNNLVSLGRITRHAGFNVSIGCFDPRSCAYIQEAIHGEFPVGEVQGEGRHLHVDGNAPNFIILNNDMTFIQAQLNGFEDCYPSPLMGWHSRRKSSHFILFSKIIKHIAEIASIDPWLLDTQHAFVDDVNFKVKDGITELAGKVDEIINDIAEKYQAHGIEHEPIVFLKDNSGTYGLGVISVRSGKEVLDLNAKLRKKMQKGKQGKRITSIFIQEGVDTIYTSNGFPAEPVLYSVGGHVVGSFLRVNKYKSERESLNSPGMEFHPFPVNETGRTTTFHKKLPITYHVLASIGNLALAMELNEIICSRNVNDQIW